METAFAVDVRGEEGKASAVVCGLASAGLQLVLTIIVPCWAPLKLLSWLPPVYRLSPGRLSSFKLVHWRHVLMPMGNGSKPTPRESRSLILDRAWRATIERIAR